MYTGEPNGQGNWTPYRRDALRWYHPRRRGGQQGYAQGSGASHRTVLGQGTGYKEVNPWEPPQQDQPICW